MTRKYQRPDFLLKPINQESYEKWLANIAPSDAHTLEIDIQLDMVRMWENLDLQSKRKYLYNILPTNEVDKRIVHIKAQVFLAAKQICNRI